MKLMGGSRNDAACRDVATLIGGKPGGRAGVRLPSVGIGGGGPAGGGV